MSEQQNNATVTQYLTFSVEQNTFGFNVLNVKEILEHKELTAVPLCPDYVAGVLNLRGNIVPVIDLRSRLFDRVIEPTHLTCVIILEVQDRDQRVDVGVLIDSVSQVVEFDNQNIDIPPELGAKIRADFIAGIGKLDTRFIILLKLESLLDLEELSALEAIL